MRLGHFWHFGESPQPGLRQHCQPGFFGVYIGYQTFPPFFCFTYGPSSSWSAAIMPNNDHQQKLPALDEISSCQYTHHISRISPCIKLVNLGVVHQCWSPLILVICEPWSGTNNYQQYWGVVRGVVTILNHQPSTVNPSSDMFHWPWRLKLEDSHQPESKTKSFEVQARNLQRIPELDGKSLVADKTSGGLPKRPIIASNAAVNQQSLINDKDYGTIVNRCQQHSTVIANE